MFGSLASVAVLQCGEFLETPKSSARLSAAAISHLLGLYHLRTLRIKSYPLSEQSIPPYGIFPSLRTLDLEGGVGHKWLSFFGAAQRNSFADGELGTSEAGIRTILRRLWCRGGTTVDAIFMSFLCTFRKLTSVLVSGSCSEGGCTFLLTEGDGTRRCTPGPQKSSARFPLLGQPLPYYRSLPIHPLHTLPEAKTPGNLLQHHKNRA